MIYFTYLINHPVYPMRGKTRKDKVLHYLNNLASVVEFWADEQLYKKEQEVRKSKDFQDFCVEQHNKNNLDYSILHNYFK